MKRNTIVGMLLVVLVALWVGSCAKAPKEEMNEARDAVARAEADADAKQYAPASVNKAKELLATMESEAAAKHYDSAKELAAQAVAAADQAIKDGAAGKAQAQRDAAAVVSTAKSSLAELLRAVQAARGVRGITLDFASVDDSVRQVQQSLDGADRDMSSSAYADATAKAQAARSSISEIQRRLSDAVQAASRKK